MRCRWIHIKGHTVVSIFARQFPFAFERFKFGSGLPPLVGPLQILQWRDLVDIQLTSCLIARAIRIVMKDGFLPSSRMSNVGA